MYDDEAPEVSVPLIAVRPPYRCITWAAVGLVADPGRPTQRVVICPLLRIRTSSVAPGLAGGQ